MDKRDEALVFEKPINDSGKFEPAVNEANISDPFDKFILADNVLSKDGFFITCLVAGTSAATATNYTHFFTAKFPCEVLSITEIHAVAGGAGSLDVRKPLAGATPGTGNSLLLTSIDLTGTANTLITKQGNTLTATKGDRTLNPGDRLSLFVNTNPTSCQSVLVTVYLKYLGRGDYRA